MDLHGFGASALAFVVAFVAAGLFTVIFKVVYQWGTPYNEGKLIREGNVAAALALGGALVGYVLPWRRRSATPPPCWSSAPGRPWPACCRSPPSPWCAWW